MSLPESADWLSQLRRGVLELCILKLLAREPNYGYEIVAALSKYPTLAAGENTIYPLLRRLKHERALESFTRDSPAGPPRQYYRTTKAGELRLKQLEADWKGMSGDVAQFLKGA